MIKLTKEQVIMMHSVLIRESGGIDGIRDDNLLESALNSPFQTFDGVELYPSIHAKASMLCYSLVNNHSFVDGNKRIGILVMIVFLELNRIELNCTDNDLIQLGLGIASGVLKYNFIMNWIINHSI